MRGFNFDYLEIGVDIIDVSRFENFDSSSRLAKNIFTDREIKECEKKKNPAESLAGRFAAKEAVSKTIEENIRLSKIEIGNDKSGAPCVNFLDKKISGKYVSKVSISHTKSVAQAACLTYKI